jgi:hypothetical protein
MGKLALLAAVGAVALSSSLSSARAADAAYTPCCQDTLKMFWVIGDALQHPNLPKPYVAPQAVAYTAPQPCCQDTLKMFWVLGDALQHPNMQKR